MLCLMIGVGMTALDEPHRNPTEGRIALSKPAVPHDIRSDFWFSALGVIASWSVLGVLLSLFPSLVEQHTEVRGVASGGAMVAPWWRRLLLCGTRAARRDASTRDHRRDRRQHRVGGRVGPDRSCAAHLPGAADVATLVALGVTFGLGFGGSLRHLSSIVPPDRRGETMSAYYIVAYGALATPIIVAGGAATR